MLPCLSTAIPIGNHCSELIPVPKNVPTVLTSAAGVIFRIALFPVSHINRLLLLSIESPIGRKKRALEPAPSASPLAYAFPANVVTTPPWVTFRMMKLSLSTTNTLPWLSTAIPDGLSNNAALPTPSVAPETCARPASVVTTQFVPVCVILRIVWFPPSPPSLMYSVPELSTATPYGQKNCA